MKVCSVDKARDIAGLIAMIEARSSKPFNWKGSRDCVAFAARAVKVQSGVDVLADLQWKSRAQALTILAAEGGLAIAVDTRLSRIPEAMAMRGDIAGVVDAKLGIRLMVVEGAMLVGPGKHGLVRLPRSAMIMAWNTMSVTGQH